MTMRARRPLILHTWPWKPAELARVAGGKPARFKYIPFEKLHARPRALKEAQGLIVLLSHPVTAELISSMPRLQALGTYSAGTNHIDQKACRARGIPVINTPDVLTRATAELAAALLLAAARRLPEGETLCRKGRFKGWAPDLLLGLELKDRHAVLVGQGRIGLETARIFQGLGLTTEFIGRHDTPADINQKLARAQVLSLHCPLTPETRHWLDAGRLKILPRDAIVLNTARGEVIDEKALISRLKGRKIFAAGLDVFEDEPKIPSALRRLQNVVLAPHLGSATRITRARMLGVVVRGVSKKLTETAAR
jgi:glyoxylate reductase